MNTTLPQTLRDALEIREMRLDLACMKLFDAALGYPSRRFDSVHVGGTNGKGSVSTKIASAFFGKKVGLFTSPHLHTYHERIQINGELISHKDANQLLNFIIQTVDQHPTYFELLTLLAFTYFAQNQVDIAVIEVGMGGRLDATNIVNPKLSVITSIDLDHTQYLGHTLEEIAYEKGGIIKPKVPVVVGPRADYYPDNGYLFRVRGSFADYEEENQAIARQALNLLNVEDVDVSIVPPCRFEQIGNVILDVGHNPAALERTFERIARIYPGEKVHAIVAFSSDKDITTCLKIIASHASTYYLVTLDHPRVYKPKSPFSLQEALEKAKEGERILICGTFFLMDEAKKLLGR